MPTDINSLNFDEKNPAKTLGSLAGIDETKAQEFLSNLPLTDYVAVVNAIQNKDLKRISDIVGKHKMAEKEYNEALDYKVKSELQKISQKSSQSAAVNPPTSPSVSTSTPTTNSNSTTTAPSAANIETTDTQANNITNTLAAGTIVDADSKSGTIAIQDPTTKKVTIHNTNDPKNSTAITTLIKNAGIQ